MERIFVLTIVQIKLVDYFKKHLKNIIQPCGQSIPDWEIQNVTEFSLASLVEAWENLKGMLQLPSLKHAYFSF